ncbi:two-component system, OmpR family, alkaline phosphatase synthesis response regulator PhoP [Algoriphagus alkaliphilus]|jgi:two-component system alkaline phosphatase synthesis response regulator PhoP|uniref:Phosphate regulon transcriptional regulatory protein PhoB n=1 Tax=Algoriphagus alkaliphilus TaxID=279824 RepID=A0A1G5WEP9_9BACT|nr:MULTISPECIES: response regulator transcription factor [Algoriphagus]MBA4299401.1 DNA-binding response regulator [Cyclobacterium sp.]MDO8965334.1 response regulator transcription factor [Algoriphagus sp.]MDP2041250.1 response regulator transcription factor [Algoriphagus sp.]MDP3198766.1 response regulator transcription factor [Algoriphagus sp.]MDP3472195.1 response regulator transcription factor [Algoriphagus sp.]
MSEKQKIKVLIVDDEPDIVEILKYNLQKEGYEVATAEDGIKGVKVATKFQPDVILLDIMMPNQDGVETCLQIRQIPELKNTFIIFLTARMEEYSEVAAFDVGADDYITKPIKPRALMSRISALFRRESKKEQEQIQIKVKDLTIDRGSYTIDKSGKTITLPKKEFELLYFLAKNPNMVFSRDELLHNIWGSDVFVLARTVDVHIRKVREKIGEDYISTVKGVGYKFDLG